MAGAAALSGAPKGPGAGRGKKEERRGIGEKGLKKLLKIHSQAVFQKRSRPGTALCRGSFVDLRYCRSTGRDA
jgi:hypothetical protein